MAIILYYPQWAKTKATPPRASCSLYYAPLGGSLKYHKNAIWNPSRLVVLKIKLNLEQSGIIWDFIRDHWFMIDLFLALYYEIRVLINFYEI